MNSLSLSLLNLWDWRDGDGLSKGCGCNEALAADFALLQLSFADRWGTQLLGMDGKAMSHFLFCFPMTAESSAAQPRVAEPYSWWDWLGPTVLLFTSSGCLWAVWSHVVLWGLEGRGCRETLQSMQCFKTSCLLFQRNSRHSSLCRLCLTPRFGG